MKSPVLLWILRIIPAIIMLQTLFFKFSASAESVYIFSTLGVEPWGRILSGVMELIAGILLVIPGKTVYGAIIGAGVMAGAIMSHLTILGIEVMDDVGQLFIYALITFVCCAILVFVNRGQLISLVKKQS
ncbi:MAG: DoxX family protein [Bacteroidia bacterium]|nr:DoxX family protein [Bacteroidia bacterium]